jgi:hypothetical protein
MRLAHPRRGHLLATGVMGIFESVLSQRDSIISGLAKADPAVTEQLQNPFLKMQSIQPTGNAGE